MVNYERILRVTTKLIGSDCNVCIEIRHHKYRYLVFIHKPKSSGWVHWLSAVSYQPTLMVFWGFFRTAKSEVLKAPICKLPFSDGRWLNSYSSRLIVCNLSRRRLLAWDSRMGLDASRMDTQV